MNFIYGWSSRTDDRTSQSTNLFLGFFSTFIACFVKKWAPDEKYMIKPTFCEIQQRFQSMVAK